MDVRQEPGYWSHEEARWIIYRQADVDVANEPATVTGHRVDPDSTVAAADQVPDGPDTERATTLTP